MKSTSPTGRTRAWCRSPKAASISTTTSITSSRCCTRSAATCISVAVCQPSVPVVAAVSIMEASRDPFVPLSMTLMGGPIDTRRNPTAVNDLAAERGIDWFRNHVITKVPFPHPGVMRDVYPGFLQLNGLHHHEPRPPHRRAQAAVQQSGEGRRRPRRQAPRLLRRISRGDGPHRGVLSADGRDRVRASTRCRRAR